MVERDSNRLIRLDIIYKVNYHYLDTAIQIFRDNLIDKLEEYTNYTLLNAYPDEVITGKKYDQTFHQIDRHIRFFENVLFDGFKQNGIYQKQCLLFSCCCETVYENEIYLEKIRGKNGIFT